MSVNSIGGIYYCTEKRHLMLVYERENESLIMNIGIFGILPIRLLLALATIIHMFITVHEIPLLNFTKRTIQKISLFGPRTQVD